MFLTKPSIIILILNLVCCFFSNANPKFYALTQSDGISNGTINCILQDHEGFMWFGTRSGLNRFDGYQIEVYRTSPDDSTGLPDNVIHSLFEDSRTRLWIATKNGLAYFNKQENKAEPIYGAGNELKGVMITSVNEDNNGIIWIGTLAGLFTFNYETNEIKKVELKIPGKSNDRQIEIAEICFDQRGTCWLGCFNTGLIKLIPDSGKIQLIFSKRIFNGKVVKSVVREVAIDKNNNLWFANSESVLYKLNLLTEKIEQVEIMMHKKEFLNVSEIYCDKYGNTWIAEGNAGLFKYNPHSDEFFHYYHDSQNQKSLLNNKTNSVYVDQQGILWVGHFFKGISYSYPKDFQVFYSLTEHESEKSGLNSNLVTSILEDGQGRLWIGTDDGGITVYNKNDSSFKYYTHNPNDKRSIKSNSVISLFRDSENLIWIGTFRGGVDIYAESSDNFRTPFDPNDDPLNIANHIRSFDEDSKGNIYIGSHGSGIIVYSKENRQSKKISISTSPTEENEIYGWLNCIHVDKKDNLWIATTMGLYKLDSTLSSLSVISKDSYEFLKNNEVIYLSENSRNELLLGTLNGLGIIDLVDHRLRSYTVHDGLSDQNVFAVLEDKNQDLWISSNKGISKLSFDSKDHLMSVLDFNETDGIQNDFFYERACYVSESGTMYFGGVNGLSYFNPDSFIYNKEIPNIVIEKLIVYGKNKQARNPLIIYNKSFAELPYWRNFLTFRFVALNFIKSEKNKYAYRLAGFDEEWTFVQNQREATYMNLKPGHYIFEVKASNNDGYWNNVPVKMEIKILHPWWASIWAYAGYFVIFTGLLYALQKIKIYREKLEHKELQAAFKEEFASQTINIGDSMPDHLSWNALDKKFMEKCYDIVRNNMSNPDFSVEMMANSIGISRTGLHKKLKILKGMSATEFIRKIRLEHSVQLLKSGNYNVNEVCDLVGYSSSYFFRAFKKEYGVSPSEYTGG